MKCVLPGLLTLVVTCSAFAQSQSEMNAMAEDEAAASDKQLNAIYKKMQAALDDEGRELLKQAQRAWIAFRDAEAKFAEDEMRGGSGAPMMFFGALRQLTDDRIAQFKEFLVLRGEMEPDTQPTPEGAASPQDAAKAFFNAYATQNRDAAAKVATQSVLDQFSWDPAIGAVDGLQMVGPTQFAYAGGSTSLFLGSTAEGRWYVHSIAQAAD